MTNTFSDEMPATRTAAQDAVRHAQARHRAALTVCRTSNRNGDGRRQTYELLAMLGLLGDDATAGEIRTLDVRVGAGRVRPHIAARRKG